MRLPQPLRRTRFLSLLFFRPNVIGSSDQLQLPCSPEETHLGLNSARDQRTTSPCFDVTLLAAVTPALAPMAGRSIDR